MESGPQVGHAVFKDIQDFRDSFYVYIKHIVLCFCILYMFANLVSRIEKKRTIIPTLVEALQNHKSSDVNLNYFYKMLFTRDNLKLVHIVCHKKEAHNLLCDTKKIFLKASDADKTKKSKVKRSRLA